MIFQFNLLNKWPLRCSRYVGVPKYILLKLGGSVSRFSQFAGRFLLLQRGTMTATRDNNVISQKKKKNKFLNR